MSGALTQHPDGVEGTDEIFKFSLQRLEVWSVFEGKMHPIPCRVQLERCLSLRDIIRHGNFQLRRKRGEGSTRKRTPGTELLHKSRILRRLIGAAGQFFAKNTRRIDRV